MRADCSSSFRYRFTASLRLALQVLVGTCLAAATAAAGEAERGIAVFGEPAFESPGVQLVAFEQPAFEPLAYGSDVPDAIATPAPERVGWLRAPCDTPALSDGPCDVACEKAWRHFVLPD